MLTPKSWVTDRSLFVKFTVTCAFAGTEMVFLSNARFWAETAIVTGPELTGGGAVVGAGAVVGGAGAWVGAGAAVGCGSGVEVGDG
jgi:hypothetical protein